MPEYGSTESRLEAMRAKDAESRGYGPNSTGKPFDWNTASNDGFNLKRSQLSIKKK